jgi:hypothetical protein
MIIAKASCKRVGFWVTRGDVSSDEKDVRWKPMFCWVSNLPRFHKGQSLPSCLSTA